MDILEVLFLILVVSQFLIILYINSVRKSMIKVIKEEVRTNPTSPHPDGVFAMLSSEVNTKLDSLAKFMPKVQCEVEDLAKKIQTNGSDLKLFPVVRGKDEQTKKWKTFAVGFHVDSETGEVIRE